MPNYVANIISSYRKMGNKKWLVLISVILFIFFCQTLMLSMNVSEKPDLKKTTPTKPKSLLERVLYTAFIENFLHQVLNPMFVFESPSHWRKPTLSIEEVFPRHKEFEAHWKEIRDEAIAASAENSSIIQPYQNISPRGVKSLVNYAKEVGGKPNVDYWKTVILRFYSQEYAPVHAACPKTMAILKKFPEIDIAMFSVMEAGATIPVHRGILRSVLRFHMGLVVPGYDLDGTPNEPFYNETQGQVSIIIGEDLSKQYGAIRGSKPTQMIKVGGSYLKEPTKRYYWKPGKGWLFDDTYAHSVINHHPSKRRRIVFHCDLRRPTPPGSWFGIGNMMFSLLKWSKIPEMVFYWNGKREKVVPRSDV